MENLNDVNITTKEGKMLIAALSQLGCEDNFKEKHPDEILKHVEFVARKIYPDFDLDLHPSVPELITRDLANFARHPKGIVKDAHRLQELEQRAIAYVRDIDTTSK